MQAFHEWFMTYHTAVSLIGGAVILLVTLRLQMLWVIARVALALALIFVPSGFIGIIYNIPSLILGLMCVAVGQGKLLAPIGFIFRTLSMLVGLPTLAFVLWAGFRNPKDFLFNPLWLTYFTPAALLWFAADVASEKLAEQRKAKAASSG